MGLGGGWGMVASSVVGLMVVIFVGSVVGSTVRGLVLSRE